MQSTQVDPDRTVRCPNCGAKSSFTSKRTGAAKFLGVITIGVGALALPKRLVCNGCGTYLKPTAGPRAKPQAAPKRPPASAGCQCQGHPHRPRPDSKRPVCFSCGCPTP